MTGASCVWSTATAPATGCWCPAARRDAAGEYDGAVTLFLDVERQRAAEENRRDLAARVVLAAEVERRRLAEDLHDGPVQQLSALALRLGVLAMRSPDPELAGKRPRPRMSFGPP